MESKIFVDFSVEVNLNWKFSLWLYDSQYIMNKIETSHDTMSE